MQANCWQVCSLKQRQKQKREKAMQSPQDENFDVKRYLEDMYNFRGRESASRGKNEFEEECPYSFFDPQYRHLAARWYRMKYVNPKQT